VHTIVTISCEAVSLYRHILNTVFIPIDRILLQRIEIHFITHTIAEIYLLIDL